MRLRYDLTGAQEGNRQKVILSVNGMREMLYNGYYSRMGYTITLYPDFRFASGGAIPVRCKTKHEISVYDIGKEIEYGQGN